MRVFGVFGNELRINSDYSGADITMGFDDYTNGFTERMRVKGNGNVGIGLNNPTSKLHVFEGTATNSRGMYIGINNGISGNEGLRVESLSGTTGHGYSCIQERERECIVGKLIIRHCSRKLTGGTACRRHRDQVVCNYGDLWHRRRGWFWRKSKQRRYRGRKLPCGAQGYSFVSGNLDVIGTLSKSAGSFKIDHPLDPSNKFLYHSFVESPDMMNVYNGNITTDNSGFATVTLPPYFEALNIDFKISTDYSGKKNFAEALVYEKIKDNAFVIRTNKPGIEVSWQVYGRAK